jgi:hypothetical protein
VERNNKLTCVKLFVENSNSAKDSTPAPIASFVTKLLISFPPNQKTIIHPGKLLLVYASSYNCDEHFRGSLISLYYDGHFPDMYKIQTIEIHLNF